MEEQKNQENKDLEIMRRVVEKKKQQSASQSGMKHGSTGQFGSTSPGNKKHKKGGLPPK